MQKHTLTMLIIFAGLLIGFALYNVNDLTTNVSSETPLEIEEPVIANAGTIKLDEDIKQMLLSLKQDTDVDVSSNIATYRRSAFSDSAVESAWVIEAATLLEEFKLENDYYPNKNQLISALASQDASFPVADPEGRVVNQNGSDYTYAPERCENEKCKGFLLSAKIANSLYQLGETGATKRTWVNETAQALDVYYKFDNRGYYPLDENFTSELTAFYPTVFEKEFVAEDPNGIPVNGEGGVYTYRGIDCDNVGCDSFVLRTTFKDGASYFQQNQ